MDKAVRYQGKWIKIKAKPYEPERQTAEIAWMMIRKNTSSAEAYRAWFAKEQENAKVLYPSFRKEKDAV